ncbi:response regulator [Sediminicoccus rosea]|uniref:Response regulator n=1 Tax=Sediminicoccus rosea TaxID=1225128 RepID=A0ABZ0PDQ8_9PROT|nr:response regulator [Sediminicoccus rosea]WPB83833.1 response regulator [Sediminicoccus rosea]
MTAPQPAVSIPFDQAFAIAHAMNNLLAIIAGRLDDIHEASPDTGDAREAAALGLLATERAARLMRGMMASLSGEIFRAGRCDSGQVLRGVQAMRRAPGLTPIAIDDAAENLALLCDPVALSDLIGNALDALTAAGDVPIQLRCAMIEAPCAGLPSGSFTEIRITGGMPCAEPDWRERALGESWRSALQRFCRAAGGDALVEGGTPGQPMVIRLCLPGHPAPAQSPAPGSAPAPVRVLMVEDDEPVRQHAERVITSLGYGIISVPTAEAALGVVGDDAQVDILFTDVILPGGMSGGELAEHVQRIRPDLPIVFTSGHNADHCVSRLLLSRGATLLPKPYRRTSLAAALEAAAMAARGRGSDQRARGD